MTERQEKQRQQKAMIISLGVHGGVFLLLLFLVAWRAPNPPNPEYGIELNFGFDDQGTGNVQPPAEVGSPVSEEPDEMKENSEEATSPAETEEVKETESEQAVSAVPEAVSKVESPEVVDDKKEDTKTAEKIVEKQAETREEVKVQEEPKAVYQPDTKSDVQGDASDKKGEPLSQGDTKNETGDKGVPEGTLDANALYGKQGGGDGGPSLDLAGWDWDNIPRPQTPDNETSGRIVFTIEVDDNGELIRYRKESGTVSAAAERACVEAIQKLTFTKKSGAKVPPVSKGRITFVIRSE